MDPNRTIRNLELIILIYLCYLILINFANIYIDSIRSIHYATDNNSHIYKIFQIRTLKIL